jgi:hypothetical protein
LCEIGQSDFPRVFLLTTPKLMPKRLFFARRGLCRDLSGVALLQRTAEVSTVKRIYAS